MIYEEFLLKKQISHSHCGIDIDIGNINDNLFDWQKKVVLWALRKGKSAIFAECGLGKTAMQLEWANQVGGTSLILAPLAVAEQTKREGEKFGYKVNVVANQEDIVINEINITNYEKIHKFIPDVFKSVVLDESSILKNFTGKIRTQIIDFFQNTQYKLCCTATPSPNDFVELGNHAEFLNVMTRVEMLSMFFINDSGDTGTWRLKGHAKGNAFWKWLSTWAIIMKNPCDIGFNGDDFILPELSIKNIIIPYTGEIYTLFVETAKTLTERRESRKESMNDRVATASDLVNKSKDQWLVWCNLNDESTSLYKQINDAVEIAGKHDEKHKKNAMLDFSQGKIKALVTKPSLAGFGMNWQNCHNMIFCGLSDSFEQYYQAIRRCWRFGQKHPVNVYIIIGEREKSSLDNINRKQHESEVMYFNMIKHIKNNIDFNEAKTFNGYKADNDIVLPKFLGGNHECN